MYRYGTEPTAEMATTLSARGEFALLLAAMAADAGLDARLAPFIAGYVLVLAILGPIAAGQAHVLARALRAAQDLLPGRTAPPYDTEPRPQDDSTPSSASASASASAAVPAEAER